MSRATRSFKLRLSPAGMDLLIDAHCHLIRATRRLIAWGTTLHVAVAYLDRLPPIALANELASIRACGFSGSEEHHVGASNTLVGLAAGVADRIRPLLPPGAPPSLGCIYLLGLQCLVRANGTDLAEIYRQTRS